jgi:protein SCO1/2
MRRSGVLLIMLSAILTLNAACGKRSQEEASSYPLKGKVISVDKEHRRVTVAHDAIPGFMEAMTMPFAIREDWPFQILAPGQQISATLVVDAGRSWLEKITVTQQSSEAVPSPPAAVGSPSPGAEVPDFVLANQAGRPIHLHQYRGKSLLLTFIYTRCPLPDYCPRLSGNFAQIHKAVQNDPGLGSRVHLLSVSFDPEHDTPDVLKGYGKGYGAGDAFRDWEFATGTPEQVKAITSYFGLEYWTEQGQITHSLRTALIAPDGKLAQIYPRNEWTPAEVLRDLEKLSRQP